MMLRLRTRFAIVAIFAQYNGDLPLYFCIYHIQYSPSNTYFNTWFILTELLVSMCWLVSTLYFKPEQYNQKSAHRWLQIQSLAVGLSIAAGILQFTITCHKPILHLKILKH